MLKTADVANVCIDTSASLRDVVGQMNQNRLGIMLVVDECRRLLGTVTDGDVRRALMSGMDLEVSVSSLLERKKGSRFERPTTAPAGRPQAEYRQVMKRNKMMYLPLLNDDSTVNSLLTVSDLLDDKVAMRAVVMAGGEGARLRPLTEDVPKPMLPVGSRPLLELVIEQLREAGINKVNISTHYKPEKITEHFGDGSNFGVDLNYVSEEHPLGTAGALSLLEQSEEPLLVINGDILTKVDFRAMLTYHQEHQADMTVAVRKYEMEVPYGVVECEGATIRQLREKPVFDFMVNAGMYLLQPSVCRLVASGEHLDMTELIQRLLSTSSTVVGFPVVEYWIDIGQLSDYERAEQDFREGKV